MYILSILSTLNNLEVSNTHEKDVVFSNIVFVNEVDFSEHSQKKATTRHELVIKNHNNSGPVACFWTKNYKDNMTEVIWDDLPRLLPAQTRLLYM